jgi:DNA-binding transcriptional LysR family regulator
LRIVAATVASSYLYVGLYERFALEHPEVSLEIVTGIGQAAAEQVARGEADAAFVQFPLDGFELEYDVLGETEIVLVGTDETPANFDLTKASLLVWNGSRELERLLETRGALRIVARTNDLALLKRFMSAGLGYAFVPRWAIGNELQSGALRAVNVPFPAARQRFGVAYRSAERSPTLEAFLSAAHEYRRVILELCR